MKNKKNFLGLVLILLGLVLIANKLEVFRELKILGIFVSILLAVYMVKSLKNLSFTGVLFPLAFIAMIFQKELAIESLVPWTLLLAALLGSIGLNLVFSRKKAELIKNRYKDYVFIDRQGQDTEAGLEIEGAFKSVNRYLRSDEFSLGKVQTVFSSIKLYFDYADLKSNHGVLALDVVGSNIEIVVPRSWKVIDKSSSMISSTRAEESGGGSNNTLIITGEKLASSLKIKYQ